MQPPHAAELLTNSELDMMTVAGESHHTWRSQRVGHNVYMFVKEWQDMQQWLPAK